jgi:hypothetical protein
MLQPVITQSAAFERHIAGLAIVSNVDADANANANAPADL